jgi:hypothetical protein
MDIEKKCQELTCSAPYYIWTFSWGRYYKSGAIIKTAQSKEISET